MAMYILFATLHSKPGSPAFTLVSYCSQSWQTTFTRVSLLASVCITFEQSAKQYKCFTPITLDNDCSMCDNFQS